MAEQKSTANRRDRPRAEPPPQLLPMCATVQPPTTILPVLQPVVSPADSFSPVFYPQHMQYAEEEILSLENSEDPLDRLQQQLEEPYYLNNSPVLPPIITNNANVMFPQHRLYTHEQIQPSFASLSVDPTRRYMDDTSCETVDIPPDQQIATPLTPWQIERSYGGDDHYYGGSDDSDCDPDDFEDPEIEPEAPTLTFKLNQRFQFQPRDLTQLLLAPFPPRLPVCQAKLDDKQTTQQRYEQSTDPFLTGEEDEQSDSGGDELHTSSGILRTTPKQLLYGCMNPAALQMRKQLQVFTLNKHQLQQQQYKPPQLYANLKTRSSPKPAILPDFTRYEVKHPYADIDYLQHWMDAEIHLRRAQHIIPRIPITLIPDVVPKHDASLPRLLDPALPRHLTLGPQPVPINQTTGHQPTTHKRRTNQPFCLPPDYESTQHTWQHQETGLCLPTRNQLLYELYQRLQFIDCATASAELARNWLDAIRALHEDARTRRITRAGNSKQSPANYLSYNHAVGIQIGLDVTHFRTRMLEKVLFGLMKSTGRLFGQITMVTVVTTIEVMCQTMKLLTVRMLTGVPVAMDIEGAGVMSQAKIINERTDLSTVQKAHEIRQIIIENVHYLPVYYHDGASKYNEQFVSVVTFATAFGEVFILTPSSFIEPGSLAKLRPEFSEIVVDQTGPVFRSHDARLIMFGTGSDECMWATSFGLQLGTYIVDIQPLAQMLHGAYMKDKIPKIGLSPLTLLLSGLDRGSHSTINDNKYPHVMLQYATDNLKAQQQGTTCPPPLVHSWQHGTFGMSPKVLAELQSRESMAIINYSALDAVCTLDCYLCLSQLIPLVNIDDKLTRLYRSPVSRAQQFIDCAGRLSAMDDGRLETLRHNVAELLISEFEATRLLNLPVNPVSLLVSYIDTVAVNVVHEFTLCMRRLPQQQRQQVNRQMVVMFCIEATSYVRVQMLQYCLQAFAGLAKPYPCANLITTLANQFYLWIRLQMTVDEIPRPMSLPVQMSVKETRMPWHVMMIVYRMGQQIAAGVGASFMLNLPFTTYVMGEAHGNVFHLTDVQGNYETLYADRALETMTITTDEERYRMEDVMYTVRTQAPGKFRQYLKEGEMADLNIPTRLKHHSSASEDVDYSVPPPFGVYALPFVPSEITRKFLTPCEQQRMKNVQRHEWQLLSLQQRQHIWAQFIEHLQRIANKIPDYLHYQLAYQQYCANYQRTITEVLDKDPVVPAQATGNSNSSIKTPTDRNYSQFYSPEMHLCPRPRDHEMVAEHGIPREWHIRHRNITTAKHKIPLVTVPPWVNELKPVITSAGNRFLSMTSGTDEAAAQQYHATFIEKSEQQFLYHIRRATAVARQKHMCLPYMFGADGYPRYCPTYQAPGVGYPSVHPGTPQYFPRMIFQNGAAASAPRPTTRNTSAPTDRALVVNASFVPPMVFERSPRHPQAQQFQYVQPPLHIHPIAVVQSLEAEQASTSEQSMPSTSTAVFQPTYRSHSQYKDTSQSPLHQIIPANFQITRPYKHPKRLCESLTPTTTTTSSTSNATTSNVQLHQ